MGQLQILGNISLGAELCIDVLSWHVIVYCVVVRRLSSPIEACTDGGHSVQKEPKV